MLTICVFIALFHSLIKVIYIYLLYCFNIFINLYHDVYCNWLLTRIIQNLNNNSIINWLNPDADFLWKIAYENVNKINNVFD